MASHVDVIIKQLSCRASISLWVKCVSFFTIIILIPSVYQVYFKGRDSECQMTYMFQYPEYIRIRFNKTVQSRFPFYRLFAYGEGGHAHQLEQGRVTGFPVIFIPGNAGSYKQMRSFASIAHRMFEDGIRHTRLDFFAIDFNEERAGIFGQILSTQVKFLAQCIIRIQQLYSSNGRTNVPCILIGHSIGGIIARGLMVEPWFDPSCVHLLITLASPHRKPVIAMDHYMTYYYSWINSQWHNERTSYHVSNATSSPPYITSGGKLSHLHHISIAGGSNDVVVATDLTMFPSWFQCVAAGASESVTKRIAQMANVNPLMDTWLVMTSIPGVWLTTDHLNIVWCKQFAIKVIRLLYDFTQLSTADVNGRRLREGGGEEKSFHSKIDLVTRQAKAIEYHLKLANRGKFYPNYVIASKIVYGSSSEWMQFTKRVDRFYKPKGILKAKYLLIPLVPSTTLLVEVNGEVRFDWVSACSAIEGNVSSTINSNSSRTREGGEEENSTWSKVSEVNTLLSNKYCESGVNLSPLTHIMPSGLVFHQGTQAFHRRILLKSADELLEREFTHVLVSLTPTSSPVNLITERHKAPFRNKRLIVNSWAELIIRTFWPVSILNVPVSDESVYYNISLEGLQHFWQTFVVTIETGSCYPSVRESGRISSLAHFHVPWSKEDAFTLIPSLKGSKSQMNIKLNIAKERQSHFNSTHYSAFPSIAFYLEPDCAYKATLSYSITNSLGQLIRFYFSLLLPFMMALTIAVLAMQAVYTASNCTFIAPSNDYPMTESLNCDLNDGSSEGEEGELLEDQELRQLQQQQVQKQEKNIRERQKERKKGEEGEEGEDEEDDNKEGVEEKEEEGEEDDDDRGISSSSAEGADAAANKIHHWILFQESIERVLGMNLLPISMLLLMPLFPFFTGLMVDFVPVSLFGNTTAHGTSDTGESSSKIDSNSLDESLEKGEEESLAEYEPNDTMKLMRDLKDKFEARTFSSMLPRHILLSELHNLSYIQSITVLTILFTLSYIIILVLSFILATLIKAISLAYTSLESKWKRITGVRAKSQVSADLHSFAGLSAKPFIMCLLLVILAFATTSGTAYAAAFLVHMIQLFPLSIKCYKLAHRTGLNQFSTCFHFHVTVAILLLFCNLATFPLTLHWHSIGHPSFFLCTFPSSFLSSPSTSDDFHSASHSANRNTVKGGREEEAGSSYYASFTDGHIIPCVLTLLCLSFVWQGKPLAVPPPRLPGRRGQKERKSLHTSHRERVGHASCSSNFSSASSPSASQCKCCTFPFRKGVTLASVTSDTRSISGSRGKSKNGTRKEKRPLFMVPVVALARRMLLVALFVISLSSSTLCHNVFLLPHFSALAILLFTLNVDRALSIEYAALRVDDGRSSRGDWAHGAHIENTENIEHPSKDASGE